AVAAAGSRVLTRFQSETWRRSSEAAAVTVRTGCSLPAPKPSTRTRSTAVPCGTKPYGSQSTIVVAPPTRPSTAASSTRPRACSVTDHTTSNPSLRGAITTGGEVTSPVSSGPVSSGPVSSGPVVSGTGPSC